tara:strand:- start:192 stop:842 length:651 start_codon:yes stop_codon:yes gene_type:complete
MRPPEPYHVGAFPTLVSTWNLKGHPCEEIVIDMIENWKDVGQHRLVKGGNSSYITGDEQFLGDKRLVDLWKTMQSCCDTYTEEAGIDYALISTSWFNTLGQGGTVEAHRHERSVISGAYYPYAEEGSNPLMLESPLQALRMNDCIIKSTNFNRYDMDVPVHQGVLVIFPSWLKHYVEPNDSKKRYVISFNTIRLADRGYIKTVKDYRIEKHESNNT